MYMQFGHLASKIASLMLYPAMIESAVVVFGRIAGTTPGLICDHWRLAHIYLVLLCNK